MQVIQSFFRITYKSNFFVSHEKKNRNMFIRNIIFGTILMMQTKHIFSCHKKVTNHSKRTMSNAPLVVHTNKWTNVGITQQTKRVFSCYKELQNY